MSSVVVLNYPGPYTWSSHRDTIPVLKKIWRECGGDVVDVWHPVTSSSTENFKKIISSDILIFPLGQQQNNALGSLGNLRKFGWNGTSLIMMAGEGILKYRQFSHHLEYLGENDILVFNSSREEIVFKNHFSNLLKTIVIPLPINESVFKHETEFDWECVRSDYRVSNSDKILLYAGRVSTQKNIISLFTILKMLLEIDENWKLFIAGSYDDLGVPYMENSKAPYLFEINYWINHLKIHNAVRFIDSLEPMELSRLMSLSDVYLSATLHCSEDFGLSVSQAVAMRLPCVTTYWGGGVDFIDKGLAKKIPVIYSDNGLKIDYKSAQKAIVDATKSQSFTDDYFTNKNIKKRWKELIEGKINQFNGDKLSTSSKDLSGKEFFKFYSCTYGALPLELINTSNFYTNPHWIESSKHLFDPLSFQRIIQGNFDFKEMGIKLPDLS